MLEPLVAGRAVATKLERARGDYFLRVRMRPGEPLGKRLAGQRPAAAGHDAPNSDSDGGNEDDDARSDEGQDKDATANTEESEDADGGSDGDDDDDDGDGDLAAAAPWPADPQASAVVARHPDQVSEDGGHTFRASRSRDELRSGGHVWP